MTNEEQKAKEEKTEETAENDDEGSESTTTPLIKSANTAADRLKAENDRREKILKREEELQARRALGGESSGTPNDEKPKEETPEEYAARIKEELRTGVLK